MTPHIRRKRGYDIVLLLATIRAKWIADTYLDEVKQVNSVRNMLGFTGYLHWNDTKRLVSFKEVVWEWLQRIYIHELYNIYGVETIIRVGSCGGIREDVNVGDMLYAIFSHTDNAMTSKFFNGTFCVSYRAFVKKIYGVIFICAYAVLLYQVIGFIIQMKTGGKNNKIRHTCS